MLVRIAVCGAAGRMGKTILEVCKETEGVEVTAAIEFSGSTMLGSDAGEQAGIGTLGVAIIDDISTVADQFDVLIDFTLATSISANLEKCRAAGRKMVIGTTGLSDEQKLEIRAAANDIGIVFAPNMSVGINVLLNILGKIVKALGSGYDIEVIEAHHNKKKDAPSGTALK